MTLKLKLSRGLTVDCDSDVVIIISLENGLVV